MGRVERVLLLRNKSRSCPVRNYLVRLAVSTFFVNIVGQLVERFHARHLHNDSVSVVGAREMNDALVDA